MSLEVVAVDFNPLMWVVWCSVCDSALTAPTDDKFIDVLEDDLQKTHTHD